MNSYVHEVRFDKVLKLGNLLNFKVESFTPINIKRNMINELISHDYFGITDK